jgi:two-component system, NtrC family, response regulator PilR
MAQPVLVVDDEADIRELLVLTLTRMGIDVDAAATITEAKQSLKQRHYELCLTDMRLPDGTGMDLLAHIAQHHGNTPVAVITAYGSTENAVEALKAGAFDYLNKPIKIQQLRELVTAALRLPRAPSVITSASAAVQAPTAPVTTSATSPVTPATPLVAPISAPAPAVPAPPPAPLGTTARLRVLSMTGSLSTLGPRLLGESAAMVRCRELIAKLARSQAPVFIHGESGSGKEVAARMIHSGSSRAGRAFVAVNCGAIPENLMESEFFGYRKGSFTGADQDRDGFFQAAQGGTLFLDEVGDLPLAMQVKLLRVIQEKKLRKIGDAQETSVDVRIISATHKNLATAVSENRFRQDLYYRLNVIELNLPSLREIPEDVPRLVQHVLQRITIMNGHAAPKPSVAAMAALERYDFPGNVRELENILERAVALCAGSTIEEADLYLTPNSEPVNTASTGGPQSTAPAFGTFNLPDGLALHDYLDQIEREVIVKALQSTRYNRTQAAKLLGVTFRSLRYRLDRLGIE